MIWQRSTNYYHNNNARSLGKLAELQIQNVGKTEFLSLPLRALWPLFKKDLASSSALLRFLTITTRRGAAQPFSSVVQKNSVTNVREGRSLSTTNLKEKKRFQRFFRHNLKISVEVHTWLMWMKTWYHVNMSPLRHRKRQTRKYKTFSLYKQTSSTKLFNLKKPILNQFHDSYKIRTLVHPFIVEIFLSAQNSGFRVNRRFVYDLRRRHKRHLTFSDSHVQWARVKL